MPKQYKTAQAFRAALEDRLKQMAKGNAAELVRLRRHVAFDRLLARFFAEANPPWILKGGYTFELRSRQKSRVTRDMDLSVPIPVAIKAGSDLDQIDRVKILLQKSALHDLHDWFEFRVGEPMHDLDAAPYGGARFPIEVRMANRRFATFHLDVGLGDAVVSAPEWLVAHDFLGFAEISPPRVAVLPREQQFAEKIHAYTLPRGDRGNTRVKDLVDLVLLIQLGLPNAAQVKVALTATFERRQTHPIPIALALPPEAWQAQYADLAAECDLAQKHVRDGFTFVATFWETLI